MKNLTNIVVGVVLFVALAATLAEVSKDPEVSRPVFCTPENEIDTDRAIGALTASGYVTRVTMAGVFVDPLQWVLSSPSVQNKETFIYAAGVYHNCVWGPRQGIPRRDTRAVEIFDGDTGRKLATYDWTGYTFH